MALIRCPDCKSRVSDAAPACPKCGYPIVLLQAFEQQQRPSGGSMHSNTFANVLWVFVFVAVGFIATAWMYNAGSSEQPISDAQINVQATQDIPLKPPAAHESSRNLDQKKEEQRKVDELFSKMDAAVARNKEIARTSLQQGRPVAAPEAAPAQTTLHGWDGKACDPNDAECAFEAYAGDAIVDCKEAIEQQSTHSVKWSDGFFGAPVFISKNWNNNAHTSLSLLGDAVEFQNDYGAMTPMSYGCTFDIEARKATNVTMFQGKFKVGN